MAEHYKSLTPKHIDFIQKQKLFFVASASGHEVNLSPKGLDSLRVLNDKELLFLDFPGSGNRTARDIREGGKITLMFNAFDGPPLILRTFCSGELIDKDHERFDNCKEAFSEVPSDWIRRFILFRIEAVETSCGYGVPIMKFENNRPQMTAWVKKKIEKGKLEQYIEEHNQPIDLNQI